MHTLLLCRMSISCRLTPLTPLLHPSHSLLVQAAYAAVSHEYKLLEDAIMDPAKRGALYAQPWLKTAVMA